MTFASPLTGTIAYKGIIPSSMLNAINADIPKCLDKTGDNASNGGGISGLIDVLSGGSIAFDLSSNLDIYGTATLHGAPAALYVGSGVASSSINFINGSYLNLINTSAITLSNSASMTLYPGSSAINLQSGTSLQLQTGSSILAASGTTATFNGTTYLNGSIAVNGYMSVGQSFLVNRQYWNVYSGTPNTQAQVITNMPFVATSTGSSSFPAIALGSISTGQIAIARIQCAYREVATATYGGSITVVVHFYNAGSGAVISGMMTESYTGSLTSASTPGSLVTTVTGYDVVPTVSGNNFGLNINGAGKSYIIDWQLYCSVSII